MEVLGARARPLTLKYRIFKAVDSGASVAERSRKIVTAWIKTHCVGRDIPYMDFENLVAMAHTGPPLPKLCEDDVTQGMTAARQAVAKYLARKVDKTGKPLMNEPLTTIQKHLFQRRGVWMGSDPYFGLEIAVLSEITGPSGVSRVRVLILTKLPVPGSKEDAAVVLERIRSIRQNDWFQFMHTDAVAAVNVVEECVETIVSRKPPTCFAGISNDFLQKVKKALQYMQYTYDSSGNFLEGVAAEQYLLLEFRKKLANGESVTFADIESVIIYRFLLEPDQQEDVELLHLEVKKYWEKAASAAGIRAGPAENDGEKEGPEVSEQVDDEEEQEEDGMGELPHVDGRDPGVEPTAFGSIPEEEPGSQEKERAWDMEGDFE